MPGLRLASFDTNGLAAPLGPGAGEPGASAAAVAGSGAGDERTILQALAIAATAADVVALQGVPNLPALEGFLEAARIAVGLHYRHALVIDGNDRAGGHPAIIGHLPIVHARSHRTISFAEIGRTPPPDLTPDAPVFSRDCLEVAVAQQGRALSLFVCHFQASSPGQPFTGPADPDRERRQAEALAVRQVIEARFADPAAAEWVVLGNLADQPTDEAGIPDPNHALGPLLDDGFAVDLVAASGLAATERWTCQEPGSNRYRRHDHLLLSPALARRNRRSALRLIRAGLPFRVDRHSGPRYPRIGWLAPAASWHCPIVADLSFAGEPADP